jgi:DNA-binding helix-hairpin-helix protein with protein kinase domain
LGKEVPSPEEAIARCLFAFDPEPEEAVLEPPPGAPSFLSLPPSVRALFLRAFQKGGAIEGARPTPQEWMDALQALRGELVRCAQWRAHVHWRGVSQCPWCEVLETVGCELFPGERLVQSPALAPADYESLSANLLGLDFEPIHLLGPSPKAVADALARSRSEGARWWASLAKGLGAVGGFFLDARVRSLRLRAMEANRAVAAFNQRAAELFMRRAGEARPFLMAAREAGEKLQDAAALEEGRLREWRESLRASALRRYLEGFLLQRYEIHGVNAGRLATLLSHGVVSAADMDEAALGGIPGLGAQLTERFLRWRRDIERGFHFKGAPVLSAPVRERITAEVREELELAAKRGGALLKRVERVRSLYAKEVQALQGEYQQACLLRTVAEAELRSGA